MLNECKAWCKKLNIRCVTRGTDPIPEKARADDFKLKQALWRENDKDIRLEMDQKEKVKNIVMPQKKIERNYLAHQTLANARIWFRYRSQIIDNIKGNRSSLWTGRMQCRHCTTGENETQQHIEECTFFNTYKGTLDLSKGGDKLIFWRKVISALKLLKLANKELFDHKSSAIDTVNDAPRSEAGSNEQVHTSPVLGGETRTRDCEGLRTSAGT